MKGAREEKSGRRTQEENGDDDDIDNGEDLVAQRKVTAVCKQWKNCHTSKSRAATQIPDRDLFFLNPDSLSAIPSLESLSFLHGFSFPTAFSSNSASCMHLNRLDDVMLTNELIPLSPQRLPFIFFAAISQQRSQMSQAYHRQQIFRHAQYLSRITVRV